MGIEDLRITILDLQSPIILPYRAENIEQFAIGNSHSAMKSFGWDQRVHTRIEHLGLTIYSQLKFTFQHESILFVDMLMARYCTARGHFYKIDGIFIGMNQFGEISGCDFLYLDIGKVFENVSVHGILIKCIKIQLHI